MKLTAEQQARIDHLLAANVPASDTRTPAPGERNSRMVRPFARQQVLTLTRKDVTALGEKWRKVEANIRWDDQCGNGHNTFSITGSAWSPTNLKKDDPDTCGCIHELIAEVFPDVAHMIKYHLTSSDGPMHYVANTLYHSSDRDCWGRKAGEPYNFETFYLIGNSPIEVKIKKDVMDFVMDQRGKGITSFATVAVPYVNRPGDSYDFGPKYTLEGMPAGDWYKAPFDTADADGLIKAFCHLAIDPDFIKPVRRATAWGKGKAPDFEAARRCAVWPDATDEQLQDADQLIERLPQMIGTFKADLEAFAAAQGWEGFTY